MFSRKGFNRACFVLALMIYVIVLQLGFRAAVEGSNVLNVVLLALMSSIVPMVMLSNTLERKPFMRNLNLSTASWAFVLGDSIALPFCLGAATTVRSSDSLPSWTNSQGYYLASLAIGVIAALLFHSLEPLLPGSANYPPERLQSPTKIYHDCGAYFLLSSMLIYVALPVVVFGWFANPLLSFMALCGFAMWCLFGVRDMKTGLLAEDQHPMFDWKSVDVIDEISLSRKSR